MTKFNSQKGSIFIPAAIVIAMLFTIVGIINVASMEKSNPQVIQKTDTSERIKELENKIDKLGSGGKVVTAGVASTLTLTASSPITGGGDLSANRSFGFDYSVAGTFTGLQKFSNASSTLFSAYQAWIGGTATTTFGVNGGISIASSTGAIFNSGLTVGSQKSIVPTEYQPATSTSMTINWLDGNRQLVRMGTAAYTVAFSNVLPGMSLRLKTCSPNGTQGAVTWSDTRILWAGGTAPTQTTTANKCDTWYFDASMATSTGSTVTEIDGAQNTF